MSDTVRDRISFGAMDAGRVRQAAFGVIHRTQKDPAMQLVGMALALFATCEALDIDIGWLLEQTARRRTELDGAFVGTFEAIREYARGELGNL